MRTLNRLPIALVAALAVTTAACGGGADEEAAEATASGTADDAATPSATDEDPEATASSEMDMGSEQATAPDASTSGTDMDADDDASSEMDMDSETDDMDHAHDDHTHDMGGMDMGSPDGERADEVDAEELREGTLQVLDGAPDAFADASGTAHLALGEMTWVTVDVDGLAPGTELVGHLHAESCETEGGPHFRFDEDGGDMPPNEVHVASTAGDDGSLTVSVTNDGVATDAMALVLHATDGNTTKALCADLPPTT